MHPEDIVLGLKEWRREEFAANWPLGFAKLVDSAIAALESEPEPLAVEPKLLATGRIQGVRYTEGQCFIVVGSLDTQAPQFGEIVTITRKPDA